MNVGFIVDKNKYLKNKLALVDACNEDLSITYKDLNILTNNMAYNLMNLGIKSGDIVMVMLSNCIELQICYFSCFKIGAVMQPLNYFITPQNIYYASTQCKPKVFITNSKLWNEKVQSLKKKMNWITDYFCVGKEIPEGVQSFKELISLPLKKKEFPIIKENNFGQLFFVFSDVKTKFNGRGVVLSHHVMKWHSYPYEMLGLNENDVVAGILHPYNALTRAVFKVGATYILITQFSGEKFINCCFKYNITFFGGTPNQFEEILKAAKKMGKFPKTLRACFTVGKLLDNVLWKEFEESFHTRIYGGMGCKELGIFSLEPYNTKTRYGSIGKVLPHMNYKIVKTKKDKKVGMLYIKSNSLISHYWINCEPVALKNHDDWFETGFEVYMDKDQYLYLTGNIKDTSISGMKRYYNLK